MGEAITYYGILHMNVWKIIATVLLLTVQTGCSDNSNNKTKSKANNDHIWKSQTEAMERAIDVETVIMESANNKLKQADDQSK